jgi:hypothetical protein
LRSLFVWRAAVKAPKDQREKRAPRVHLAKRANQDRRGQLVLGARPVLPVLRDRQVRPLQIRVVRIDCGTSACTAACNQDEVLVTAYCGPRRSAVTLVNERSASCPRGAGTSPLVTDCAKITPQ